MSVYRGKHLVLGANGKDGITFTPSVSDEGVLSWTNDGNLDNPQPILIKGDDGKDIKAIDCTRAEYDAMEYHDPDTYYNIIDEDNGLATHETDGLMSKEDKIKLDGMSGGDNTINGIPVDLTGIYNTQVIGYDEESGKLVPMINVARKENIVPNPLRPAPWDIEIIELPSWLKIKSTADYPLVNNPNTAPRLQDNVEIVFKSNTSYMLSEFTNMRVAVNYSRIIPSIDLYFEISKYNDFREIEASYSLSLTQIDCNITELKGSYYWRFKYKGVTSGDANYEPGNVNVEISKIVLS